jgi:hypothetical protein
MKIASLAKARIMRLFLDVILKISALCSEPALSLERETYLRQEAKVLSLDETESEELIPDRSFFCMRDVFFLFAVLQLQVAIER